MSKLARDYQGRDLSAMAFLMFQFFKLEGDGIFDVPIFQTRRRCKLTRNIA